MALPIETRMRLLTTYLIILSLLCMFLLWQVLKIVSHKGVMDELTVKRINIVDETGQHLRLVISNETRQHPGRANGKDLPKRKRPAGLLFFNNDGDECGGLIYSVTRHAGTTNSSASLTMDQYHNDQVVQLSNEERYGDDGKGAISRRGLSVNSIPLGLDLSCTMAKYEAYKKISDATERERKIRQLILKEGLTTHLFVGVNEDGEYGMFLFDNEGRYRFKLFLDKHSNPRIQGLDSSGRINEINIEELKKGK